MVSRVWIQKFSVSLKRCHSISLGFFVLVSLSITMNFACLLKLWIFSWKCLHSNMVLGWRFFTSFLWLFSIILKGVSALPSTLSFTYRTFHQVFGICSVTIYFVKNLMFFESVDSWKLMLLWLGCGTEFCYFQNTGSISLVSKVLLFILFTVFFLILLLPMSSLRFLWRLKAVTGSFWKTFFRDSLTDSMFQFFE